MGFILNQDVKDLYGLILCMFNKWFMIYRHIDGEGNVLTYEVVF